MSHRRIIIYHVRARMGLEQSKEKLHRGAPVTLVALGDSLTSGWMVRKGYLEYLTEMIEQAYPSARLTIINRGIPGDTADNGRVRVYSDVIAHKPDLVFIQFALNDAVMGYSPQQFATNMRSILSAIQAACPAEILLITSVCLMSRRENEVANMFYRAIEDLADSFGLSVAKVHDYMQKKIAEGLEFRRLVQGDMVHPTSEGYRLMAEAIMLAFQ